MNCPMDSLQEQVTVLTTKVDALHTALDQVNHRVAEILNTSQPTLNDGFTDSVMGNDNQSAVIAEGIFEHKDILMDTTYSALDHSSTETQISPEVQVRRLTAQLTAAYNRIAALEEQLLAQRSHH